MSNPMLNSNRFVQDTVLNGEPMTIQGTVNKIFMLFACLIAGAAISVYYVFIQNEQYIYPLIWGSILVAFILAMVTAFMPKAAKYTAAPYALLEGIALGGFSTFFEAYYKGIVLQAVIATFAVLFTMLLLYKAKIIKYTAKFNAVLLTALSSVLVIYIIQIIAQMFSRSIPLIFDAGPVGIVFSLIVVGVAAACFISDFFLIEESSNQLLDKDFEWYGAFSLMVTVVWLYLEILRLLAKLNSRR